MPAETAENGSTCERTDAAHGARRAVLLVVGVEDEEDLERPLQHGVRLVSSADLERHVHEVADVVQVVPRQHVRQAARVAEGERRDRRHLRDRAGHAGDAGSRRRRSPSRPGRTSRARRPRRAASPSGARRSGSPRGTSGRSRGRTCGSGSRPRRPGAGWPCGSSPSRSRYAVSRNVASSASCSIG